ncbi:MAG: hypothetical protein CMJ64_25265 [Planctomycetaceae bacterium]|nr:hypothetical protein [Planctomycetaceae bacterium]
MTRPADIGRSLEGRELGQFRLDEFVGGGGMGAVFRGVDTTLDRIVAVKVVSNDQTDEDTLRRFRNEAQSAARLDHPNIARVYSVGEAGGWNFIVFEFIEGVNVRDLVMHKGPLPIDEAISYVIQASDALQHASDRDVVHRDIKPSNLLVMESGRAKLVDMGLARLHHVGSTSDDITATGVTLGTFDYISPEQAHDPRNTDVRSDLYSLGCTLYYMLTGMPPFPEGTVLQKLLNHNGEEAPDPRDLRGDVPPELSAVCLKLMAKHPNQRYQQPRDLVAELSSICDALGFIAPRATVSQSGRSAWFDRIAPHIPLAVPLVLLFAIVFGVESLLPDAEPLSPEQLVPKWQPREVVESSDTVSRVEPIAPANAVTPSEKERAESETMSAESEPPAEPVAEATEGSIALNSEGLPPFEESAAILDAEPTRAMLDLAPDSGAALRNEGGTEASETDVMPVEAESDGDPIAYDRTRVIVMPDPPPSPDPNPMIVRSLEEAVHRLPDYPGAAVIELRFNRQRTRPLTLGLRRDLLIEAGRGYHPVVTFDAEPADDKRMLHLLGGRLTLKRVHLEVDVPAVSEGGWAMFHLNEVKQITLSDSSLTMRNDYRADAAFFQVQGPSMSDPGMPGEEMPALSRPIIELTRCIARGQATLVKATEGLPFQLRFTEGFFVTTERLAELGALAETVTAEVATLHMRRVTAMMEQGMCRVAVRGDGTRLPELYVNSQNCLLRHRETAPLIEHSGVDSVDIGRTKALTLAGDLNAYPNTKICWRIQPRTSNGLETAWDERKGNIWYEEGSSEPTAAWVGDEAPDPSLTPYKVLPADYSVVGDLHGFSPGLEAILPLPSDQDVESD